MALTLPMLAEPNRGRPSEPPAGGQPTVLPAGIPGALPGPPGGMPPNLPPATAQRLQGMQQPSLPMRAMPSESADETPGPNPALR